MAGIEGVDYAGRRCRLVVERTGEPVRLGDVLDGRRIDGATPPHRAGTSGRVDTDAGSYYAFVVGAKWIAD